LHARVANQCIEPHRNPSMLEASATVAIHTGQPSSSVTHGGIPQAYSECLVVDNG